MNSAARPAAETIFVRHAEQNRRHAENRDGQQHCLAGLLHRRTMRDEQCADDRADGHRVAQPAQSARAGVKNIVREHRQNRHRAAEQHGEQIQRDDAEDDFILINKIKTFDEASHGNRLGRFRFVDVLDRQDQRKTGERRQGVQCINRPRRVVLHRVRRQRDDRAERDRPRTDEN
jgi:hypothetical protein